MTSTVVIIIFVAFFIAQICESLKVELIHHDSPASPFFDPSKSRFERFSNAFHRSHHLHNDTNNMMLFGSEIKPVTALYSMKFSIGTPPIETYAFIDTGSALTWTQCMPCEHCYPQSFPLFDSRMSSSYEKIVCDSPLCADVDAVDFSCNNSSPSVSFCQYRANYMDGTYSVGEIATETLTIGNVAFPNVLFGCGRRNTDRESVISGIVGLAPGSTSILTQLDLQIGGKFAFCLPSTHNTTSFIAFGPDANPKANDDAVVSVPWFQYHVGYWVLLENISVNNKFLNSSSSSTGGNINGTKIVVDSGTYLTYLPNELCEALETELKNVIESTPVSGPGRLCYNKSDLEVPPTIAVHFVGGADIVLSPKGTFGEWAEGVLCLTLVPADDSQAMFGNLSHMDYIFYFDVHNKTISFKPTVDCSTL